MNLVPGHVGSEPDLSESVWSVLFIIVYRSVQRVKVHLDFPLRYLLVSSRRVMREGERRRRGRNRGPSHWGSKGVGKRVLEGFRGGSGGHGTKTGERRKKGRNNKKGCLLKTRKVSLRVGV